MPTEASLGPRVKPEDDGGWGGFRSKNRSVWQDASAVALFVLFSIHRSGLIAAHEAMDRAASAGFAERIKITRVSP
ncbi:UNVERIFIED_ORG: hypothetical protein GGD48_005935 [Rhizobium etli]